MRILFVRLSSFGDVVFALPAAKALRTALPGARLAWAIEGPLAPLVEGAPYVDEIRRRGHAGLEEVDSGKEDPGRDFGFSEKGKRARSTDLVVDAQGLFKSALITAAIPAGRKVGFGFRTATEWINCLFTDEHVEVDRLAHTSRTGCSRSPST